METGIIWGDIATWVTGIATIALFIIGFLQIRNERESRIKRENELENQRRRSQAELISSWIANGIGMDGFQGQWIAILNQSTQPVYQIIVSVVPIEDLGQHRGEISRDGQACIDIAPPGRGYVVINAHSLGAHRRLAVEIAF